MDNITPAELEVLHYALSLLEEKWNGSTFDGKNIQEAAFISISYKLTKLQQAQWNEEASSIVSECWDAYMESKDTYAEAYRRLAES